MRALLTLRGECALVILLLMSADIGMRARFRVLQLGRANVSVASDKLWALSAESGLAQPLPAQMGCLRPTLGCDRPNPKRIGHKFCLCPSLFGPFCLCALLFGPSRPNSGRLEHSFGAFNQLLTSSTK